MAEVGAGVAQVLGVFKEVRAGINGILKARWRRRRLAEELCRIQDTIREARAEYEGKGSPVSSAGKQALATLEQRISVVEGGIAGLQKDIAGLQSEMTNVRQRGPAVEGNAPSCSFSCGSWLKGFWNALWPPEWLERIPVVSKQLREDVEAARAKHAFVFGHGFCDSVPPLYIRPEGLYAKVVDYLGNSVGGGRARGVLIWGGKGMGKSSLARDVAHAFAFEPALADCYPDGVFHLDCAQGVSVESLHRALLDKLQGINNTDPEIRGTEGQGITSRLQNHLQGKRCLIWLDNVREPRVVDGCCPEGFVGALLITANAAKAEGERLPDCLSVNIASRLFWEADGGSGDRIATKVLAARAADNKETQTFPPGCEEAAKALLDLCEGSVLALAVIGNHLRGKTSPQDWESIRQSFTRRLKDCDRLPGDYPLTVFGALDLVFDGLPDDERNVVMAFWQFRPGADLPLPLVKLTVEVETRREWDCASLDFSLEKIVKANLLELCDGADFVAAAGGEKGYRLLELVAMWLTEKNKHRIQQPLFQDPPDGAGPSGSQDQLTKGQATSTAEEHRQKQCSLLAAFLGMFGKVEGSLNVPKQAEHFLDEALGLGFRGWADPNLGSRFFAARRACKIKEGLSAEAVIAAILARRGFLKGSRTEALQDLDQADRLQPNDALTLQLRGATMVAMGRPQEALQDLDRADRLQPSDAWTLKHRGASKFAIGRHDEALQDLDQANRLQPNDAWTLKLRGTTKGAMGKHEEALQDLDQADRLQADDAWTLKHRGATKFAMGRHKEALQDLDRADRLQPNDAWTLKRRGATKFAMGRHKEALQDLDRADRLQPNDASTLKRRGSTKFAMGRYKEALTDQDRADRLLPAEAWRLKRRGATKMDMGRHKEALQDLDRADRLQPNDAWTLKRRGATKFAMGRHKEALQDLDRADRLQPNDAWTLQLRGATNFDMGRHEEALQDLNQADCLQPNDAWILKHSGATKLAMGRHEEALQDLDQAHRLQPNNVFTLKHRGAAKWLMGRLEEALLDLDQADRLRPNDAFILKFRGATKLLMGRLEEALQDLDQADSLTPKDAFTLQMRGAVQWKRGQLPAALRDLEETMRLAREQEGDVLALRAVIKQEGGDPEGARQDALRAREALSGLPPHRYLPGSLDLCQAVLQSCGGGGEPSPQQTPAVGGEPSPQQSPAAGGDLPLSSVWHLVDRLSLSRLHQLVQAFSSPLPPSICQKEDLQ
eukprot:jgi/Botrbrau1/20070/Bobra.200_1s0074.1